jgi:hypothetical protein
MKLIDVYKLALSKGLSGKEASYEYGVKYHSLWMAGHRHKMPPLVRDNRRTTMYRNMTNEQLLKCHDSVKEELETIIKIQSDRQVAMGGDIILRR